MNAEQANKLAKEAQNDRNRRAEELNADFSSAITSIKEYAKKGVTKGNIMMKPSVAEKLKDLGYTVYGNYGEYEVYWKDQSDSKGIIDM